jgi:two-component system KDP operon response regulator KdpE
MSIAKDRRSAPDRAGGCVLLVEDDPDIRTVVRTTLEGHHYRVVEVGTAREGIDSVEVHHPHLVILDLMLPGKDGWWFLREVQQCPSPRPAVMVLSARSGQPERVMAQMLGAAEFMVKPFDPDQVVKRVRSLIGPADEHRALG